MSENLSNVAAFAACGTTDPNAAPACGTSEPALDWQLLFGHFFQRLRPAFLNSTGLM